MVEDLFLERPEVLVSYSKHRISKKTDALSRNVGDKLSLDAAQDSKQMNTAHIIFYYIFYMYFLLFRVNISEPRGT